MKKEQIGILIDVNECVAKRVEIPKELGNYYNMLNCSTVQIVRMKLGGVYFDVYCDEEARLKFGQLASAADKSGNVALVGNILFTHTDSDGETIGLKEEEMVNILSHVTRYSAEDDDGKLKNVPIVRGLEWY